MWGLAVSLRPRAWRIGKCAAEDEDGRIIGVWWCFGPFAICYDYYE